MIFSTPVFFAFFVVYFALHFAVPRQHRLWLIIAGSTVFYAWWKIEYLWIPFLLMAIAWLDLVPATGSTTGESLASTGMATGLPESVSIWSSLATGPLTIASTYDAADEVAWRQWHHWNVAKGLVKVGLKKGINVLTVHTVAQGQMNYATLEFHAAKQ